MIHELLGGGVSATATLLAGERNPSNSINGGTGGGVLLVLPPTTQSPSSTTTVTATATTSVSENQNLRCPRCDSSNTKFCYYNNYNLTQPRHFCKTCRRYWTKGGALRNVPIGGGCRKNRSISGLSNSSAAAKTTAAAKMKTVASEFVNGRSPSSGSLLGHGHGFEIEREVLPPAPPSQILWGSPQNISQSHVLALLRASQNPNPNTVSAVAVKEEGNYLNLMGSHSQSHMVTEPLVSINSNGLLNNNRSYDGGVGNVLCSSFWRNNQDHQPQQQQQNGGFLLGEQTQYQNSNGIQGLYQKLIRSSSGNNNYCSGETSPVFLGNVASNSSSISNILESTSVAGGELGYWNPTLSWSDLPTTTNGAYP